MATVEAKSMTADEFYEWSLRPENRGKNCDLVRGEIEEMSRPGKQHSLVCANIIRILGNFTVQRLKGYVCSNDTGTVVERDPDTVRGPDVLVFEDVEHFDQVELKYGETPPLLAVEVLSPNDSAGDLMQRVREQLRFGTRLVWVVDPGFRSVTVYGPGTFRTHDDTEELTGDDVLPDFRCKVAEFFTLHGR